MKKLLTILGAVGLMATTGASVAACGPTKTDPEAKKDINIEKGDITIAGHGNPVRKIENYDELKNLKASLKDIDQELVDITVEIKDKSLSINVENIPGDEVLNGKIILTADNANELSINLKLIPAEPPTTPELTNDKLKEFVEAFATNLEKINFNIKIGTKQNQLLKIAHKQFDELVKKQFEEGTVWGFGWDEAPNQWQIDNGKTWDHPEAGNVWNSDDDSQLTLSAVYGAKDTFKVTVQWTITFVS